MTLRPKIAIIGAGMSGLSAAHILNPHCDVTLFDKSRGTGGRMSTRYAGEYEFDHGAQYFTVKEAGFRQVIDTAIAAGTAAPWQGRALSLKSDVLVQDLGGDRYVGMPRMNSLPKFLARDLSLERNRRVSKMVQDGQTWRLEFESGPPERGFEAVICTAPPAQAQHLLPENFSHMPSVKSAKMNACFAVMVGLPDGHDLDLNWDSLRISGGPIAWMAVNSAKPERKASPACLIIHAEAAWSEAHQEASRDWVQSTLLEAASGFIQSELPSAPHIALHRWLYGSVETSPETDCLFDAKLKLAACGDWCQGGRVEGAWLSGKAAAMQILKAVNR